jgi:hypothetical protein
VTNSSVRGKYRNIALGILLAVLVAGFVACVAVFVVGDVQAFETHQ